MDSSVSTPAPALPPGSSRRKRDHGNVIGGLVLVVLGLLFLGDNLLPNFRFGDYWPVILIVIGGGLLWKSRIGMNQ
jgi:phage shock protein C